jgi:hypothetical protein
MSKEDVLREATDGLLFTSETDAPFEYVHWEWPESAMTLRDVRELTDSGSETPVEEADFGEFFADVTRDEKWHDEEDRQTIQRYRQLESILKDQLNDLRVFRVGETEIEIYIVGRTTQGIWEGLRTLSVET